MSDINHKEKNNLESNSRFKRVVWYITQMFLIILACTNTIFLVHNIDDFRINLSPDNMILTAVGFFFAFAGINIYSIFNTNIEEEKKRLTDLSESYEKTLNGYKENIDLYKNISEYSRRLIKFHQFSLLISSSKKFNSQIYSNWLPQFNNFLKEYHRFLLDLHSKLGNTDLFTEIRSDFTDICRGSFYSFSDFRKFIENNKNNYFINVQEIDVNAFIKKLDSTIKELETLQVEDFIINEDDNEASPHIDLTICESLQSLFNAIRKKISSFFKCKED